MPPIESPPSSTVCALPKLLFLGFAFPPGAAALYPHLNPAGHALETQLIGALRRHFQIRSVGLLPVKPPPTPGADPGSGIPHELLLLEKPPELYHRFLSLAQLKRHYQLWRRAGWEPDLVLVYNLSPVYNQFITWLRNSRASPKLVLLLLDSPNLGQEVHSWKQFRRRFKPLYISDAQMLGQFDACIGLSQSAAKYFERPRIPFLWMPGGCAPDRALIANEAPEVEEQRSFRFGYFGALGAHAGVSRLIQNFLAMNLSATLEICGYGKAGDTLRQLASGSERFKFLGLLTPTECLRFGRSCDVLINPRPATHGNENNFPSKIFEYALCGRAILTSQLSGVQNVLGPEGFYFDPVDFDRSLQEHLKLLVQTPRSNLNRRGAIIQARLLKEFSWAAQAARVAEFLQKSFGLGKV